MRETVGFLDAARHPLRVMPTDTVRSNAGGMASSPDQGPGDPGGSAAPPPARHGRPWGWITVCVLLVLVAGGLAIWALSLNSDLSDQRDQTAQAQQEAEQASKEVETLSGQVDQLTQSVKDAGDQLSQAGADAQKNAEQTLSGVQNKLDSMKGEIQNAIDKAGASKDTSAP
jgi:uncharacterized protein HemX